MATVIITILEYVALGVFALWVIGYLLGVIPSLVASRVARTEEAWVKDTVEYDRFGMAMTLLPAPFAVLPCLLRLWLGTPVEHTWAILPAAVVFTVAVLFQTAAPQLRYDGNGIFIRGGSGKEYFIGWERVIAVEWQSERKPRGEGGGRRARIKGPAVVIRYTTELLGKTVTDIYVLEPTRMRGIRRFLQAWDTHAPKTQEPAPSKQKGA